MVFSQYTIAELKRKHVIIYLYAVITCDVPDSHMWELLFRFVISQHLDPENYRNVELISIQTKGQDTTSDFF